MICNRSFQNKSRRQRTYKKIWNRFALKKQTVETIESDFHLSSKTIRTYLDHFRQKPIILIPRHIMVIMDCVYFRRVCCYLVIRDWYRKKNIFFKRIPYETINDYVSAINFLESQKFVIDGIVVDGRKGVFEALSPQYPIQMCQFHQKQIVRRYITNRPKTEAGRMLKEIVRLLPKMDDILFEFLLDFWYERYQSFIKERTVDPVTHRWFYTHKRLRSAYRSLRKNLPFLFTYQKTENMPNTTNSLDGFFAHLKDAVSIHRGLRLHRRTKLIEDLIVSKKTV